MNLFGRYEPWMEDAFCSQVDPDLWHPDDAEGAWAAKRLCKQHCPVIEQCLRHAFDNDETEGVWGGLTAGERKRLLAGQPTHRSCEKNHPGEPRDERWSMSDGKGYADCRVCERVRTARRRARNQAKVMESGEAA